MALWGRGGGLNYQPRESSPVTTELCRLYHVAGAKAAGADPDVLDGSFL